MNALLCCSAAVLLTACGGGVSDTGAGQTQTAAVVVDSATSQFDATVAAPAFGADVNTTAVADAATSDALAAAAAEGETRMLASTVAVAAATPSIYHLYVSTTGNDSNTGTQAKPFRTITRAAKLAKPSTTVHVAAGAYNESVKTTLHGTATARIRYVSDTKWGAKVVGIGTEGMWTNNGNYTEISGFDITGPGRIGILNYASNTVVVNNHIHNLKISGGCSGSGGSGIVNANYSGMNGDIVNNVVHDIGVPGSCNGVQGIYSSNQGGLIYNNIVYRVSAFGIHLWHAASGVIIANNTVFANGSSGMGGGIVTGSGDSPGGMQLKNTKVINNIVYNNPGVSIKQYCYSGVNCIGSGNVTANNLVYGNGSGISLKTGTATGTITQNPLFINYQANGTGNYRLQSNSPAINKGVASSAPIYDMDNFLRPKGGALDIGAYESF
ncbi:right-handed parallel beta-helix repeat-containing protein [Massilia eurypsychrophila]|uniref:right-handed parallel beta-helix repeat-containing protein n=1 Tax=Massilia eurypsychrophila TaxID=1485217 RepID=UPI001E2E7918|nr:right-handed parallel beta-helix repeat-containing protein [Massilia eurypsychrophila]